MELRVKQGSIEVEAISGVINQNSFVLYVTTREKYAEADVPIEDVEETVVFLVAGERTLRPSRDGVTRAVIDPTEEGTTITIPGSWCVEASGGRYTVRIVGVRKDINGELSPVPFTEED